MPFVILASGPSKQPPIVSQISPTARRRACHQRRVVVNALALVRLLFLGVVELQRPLLTFDYHRFGFRVPSPLRDGVIANLISTLLYLVLHIIAGDLRMHAK